MPTDLPTLSPLKYQPTVTIPNPGEPRTIGSIATAPSVGLHALKNSMDWSRSRIDAALRAPMQSVTVQADTGQTAGVGTVSMVLHHAHLVSAGVPIRIWLAGAVGVGSFWSYDGLNWDIVNDIAAIGGSETSWNQMADDGTTVVIVGDNEVRYTAWPISWSACSGGVTAGAWKAVAHDGTNFIAGDNAGQFAYSADGITFSAVVSGDTDWLAGGNDARQITAGKGPGGVNGRVIAVPDAGDLEVFNVSDDNGVTWSDVVAPSSTLTWSGIAYRETDHLWVAAGSAAGNTVVYASDDGGDTWSHQQTFPGGGESRLFVMNDHFVMMAEGGGVVKYAHDVAAWKKGLTSRRDKADGTAMSIVSFVKGGGRFGWFHAISSESIYVAFSQAGDFEFGDDL